MKGDTTGQGVVPLRTILRNILNLIDSFETRYKEGLDSYDTEFQELKQFSENLKSDPSYLCKEGEKNANRKKNRYKDILPFDYTRVILGDYGDVPGSDYINANFIKGASGSSAYIACQGPLPHTVNDFWRMVVECEVQVIVMACNEQESGKHKCENYWVEEEGVEREFGSVTIWLKKCRQVCPDFLVRTMKIRYPNAKGEPEERSVCQFHYSAWPDHGVPLKVRPLLDMVRLIRDCQTSETLPVLVHCSAGCGRTGTICAIDYVWGLLRLGKLTPEFSLFNLVREMRRQRIAMVQTKDQYILVHRAVRELFEEQLKIIDSHPYANVDINGLPIDMKLADLEEPVYETVQFIPPPIRLPDDQKDSIKKDMVGVKPPSPPLNVTSSSVQVQYGENREKHQDPDKIVKFNSSNGISSSSKPAPTPSPSSGSNSEQLIVPETRSSTSELDRHLPENKRGQSKSETGSGKQGSSSKSSLLRNPSIVKLKAFFEKSKDDKEKKAVPGLSRAKSDVSSSSRFYTSLTSTFTSRGNRKDTSHADQNSSETTPPKRERTPVEKIKSKPSILSKPNVSVKRSKSLRLIRPTDNSREDIHLISNVSLGTDVPDGHVKSKDISATSYSSSSIPHYPQPPESHAIKVSVQQVEMPKLQKPFAKSVKPESYQATTSYDRGRMIVPDPKDNYAKRVDCIDNDYQEVLHPPKKPEVPSKSHLLDKVLKPGSMDLYGTTRIKIGISLDDSVKDSSGGNHSKLNGKVKKYGTVTSKMLTSSGGGTLLTRSQSHVWQPSKPQVPVRIFSDDNISQVGTVENVRVSNEDKSNSKSFDQPDSIRLQRKQSLPIAKLFATNTQSQASSKPSDKSDYLGKEELQQPRSLTLTSHSSFVEARKRLPKTNPYANYSPSNENQHAKDLSQVAPPSTVSSDKLTGPITQFHFGESIPLLKNGNMNSNLARNSSESSSNAGTPRNSLPGTPTQSTDVLYSLNVSANGSTGRNQSKSILKGSLSSTPSESDERLDLTRAPYTSSLAQSQVTTNITGPQKISSVRTGVGIRERRNSFRQAVWKEDQRTQKEDGKPENIYITTTSSVPYFVKSTAMPIHPNSQLSNSISMYSNITPGSNSISTNGLERPHRDYEPIWPDPTSTTNPFKIGPTNTRPSHIDNPDKIHRVPSSNSSASIGDEKLPGTKAHKSEMESQVQDRMAEIKVLLEELKAPGRNESLLQRLEGRSTQIPTRKLPEQQPSVKEPSRAAGHSASSSGLKYHRSLRAPSRPQYQQSLVCFSFKKPSSFESISDQIYAEELAAKASERDEFRPVDPLRNKTEGNSCHEANPQQPDRSHPQNPRTNDYVSLRNCKSSSVRTNPFQEIPVQSTRQPHHPLLGKSESTPIPPPRSKRGGTLRRDQNYVNVTPDLRGQGKYGWPGKDPQSSMNGNSSNNHHTYSNGSAPTTMRQNSSTDNLLTYSHQMNGSQDYSMLSNPGSVPPTNNNGNATSPKAIIRALGLFQAKAANVRSRFANWSENKERAGSKRTN